MNWAYHETNSRNSYLAEMYVKNHTEDKPYGLRQFEEDIEKPCNEYLKESRDLMKKWLEKKDVKGDNGLDTILFKLKKEGKRKDKGFIDFFQESIDRLYSSSWG